MKNFTPTQEGFCFSVKRTGLCVDKSTKGKQDLGSWKTDLMKLRLYNKSSLTVGFETVTIIDHFNNTTTACVASLYIRKPY